MAPLGTCVDLAVTVPTLFAHAIRPRPPKFLCNFYQASKTLCKRGLRTALTEEVAAARQARTSGQSDQNGSGPVSSLVGSKIEAPLPKNATSSLRYRPGVLKADCDTHARSTTHRGHRDHRIGIYALLTR
jgi:hypothetical protein